MTHLKFIGGLLLLMLLAWRQPTVDKRATNSNTQLDYPPYITFGVFCGECSGHCATMYHYNMMGNTSTLFVDSTDSYFKNHGKIICKTQIFEIAKFQIVNKLVQGIPKGFLNTKKAEQIFGCPDCADGCGIYFEVGHDTSGSKFYIDYNTDKLDNKVKD